jgi:hypothetical protein
MAIQFLNLVDVSETRTGATATDAYTLTVSTRQTAGASPNPGTGGLKVQYNDGTNDHGFGLVAGTTSSDFLTTGPMYFYTNSDLDTKNATGLAMVIDSSQNVGIGTTSPDHKLHLEESDTTPVFLKTENTAGALLVGNNSSGNSFVSSQTSGKDLLFETVNTERMRIDSSGVTTFKPVNNTSGQRQSKFDSLIIKTDYNGGDGQPYTGFGGGLVFNNETYNGTFYDSAAIYSGIGDDSISTTAGGHLAFYTSPTKTAAPTEKMHIDSIGDVGINQYIYHLGDTTTKFGFVANNNFSINTAGIERVRVTSGGSVGIATNNPGAKLDVEGNAVIGAAGNIVNGDFAVAINKNTVVTSEDGFAQGENTIANGRQAAAFGFNTYANAGASIAGGALSESNGQRSIAVGATAITNADDAAAFNVGTRANGLFSFATGQGCFATGNASFVTGSNTQATGLYSFSGGVNSIASGNGAVALGGGAQCSGEFSFAAGNINVASGINSTALGFDNDAIGAHSTVIGHLNTTSAAAAYGVAINFQNTVSGQAAFAFNQGNTVSGLNAAAGGVSNTVDAEGSFAYGFSNDTSGTGATPPQQILLGRFLKPPRDVAGNAGEAQVIVGRHNKHANQPATAFAVGTGTAANATANSFTVQYDGNVLMEQVVGKNYSSDSAAASAGVPIGGIYHDNGDLKIRRT